MRFATPRLVDGFVFLLLLSGPPKLRMRDATASLRAEIDTAVIIQLLVWTTGLVWLGLRLYPALVEHGMVPRLAAPQIVGGLLLLVLAAGVSMAPGPLMTAYAVFQLAIMLAFSWVFVQLYGPEACVRYLFVGYLLLAVALFVAWFFMPELVVRRDRLRGDLIAPAGPVAALGLMLCLSGALRLRTAALVSVGSVFAVVLLASQTRTAIAAFALCVVLGWMFRHPAPVRKLFPVLMVALLVAALADVLVVGKQYVVREHQSLATLSDRVPLWEHLVGAMLRDSPVIGLGYHSASRVLGPQYNVGLGDAHSGFVEVLVGGGLLGGLLLFVLCAVMVACALKLFAHGRDDPLVLAVLGLFTISFITSVTSTEGFHAGPVGFTFWSAAALLPAVRSRLGTRVLGPPPIRRAEPART